MGRRDSIGGQWDFQDSLGSAGDGMVAAEGDGSQFGLEKPRNTRLESQIYRL